MLVKTVLNNIEKFKSFVYGKVSYTSWEGEAVVVVEIKSRKNSRGKCPECGKPCGTYDTQSTRSYEYVPFPEIKWVAGGDWSSGIWRITAEYSGKGILDFTPSAFDPVFGTEPDYAKLAELFQDPDFDPQDYVRQQVAAFNRLYNYQLEKYYHSAGVKIDADLVYGKLTPSVFSIYNFTSGDLLIIPQVKFKPADGLSITAGAEFYSGTNGSLFDIVDGFMNSVYLSLRVDF